MLATNQEMYKEVLTLKEAKDESGMINWQTFFHNSSVYKQIYNFEIIEAVMNESADQQQGDRRVFFVEYQDTGKQKNKAGWLPPQLKDKDEMGSAEDIDNAQQAQQMLLKSNWTKQFVEQQGIQFVVDQVQAAEFSHNTHNSFELKNKSFLLTLLRVFIIAAIAGQPNMDTTGSLSVLRRKSSVRDAEEKKEESDVGHDQLVNLLKEAAGTELLLSLDFQRLQNQIMRLVASILVVDNPTTEEKQIVENSLSLWIGLVNYKPELLADFVDFKCDGQITTASELLMHGVLYCKEEKIRQDFKTALTVVGRHGQALSFIIKVLSAHFNQISDYPCVQFFELYNELIDLFYAKQALGTSEEQNVFDPETLLSFIVDKIREQKQATTETDKDEDEIFAKEKADLREKFRIGLIQLMCKIITKVAAEVSEKIVQEKDLIREVFREFLFASFYD